MYDFKIPNVQLVCPQTNSMISTRQREVSWTSCSMLGGLSLAQSWYFYMFGPKWSVECSNVTASMIQLVQSNQQIPPPTPKFKKVSGNVQCDFHFLVRQKSRPRFCQKRPTSWWFDTWKWIWSCQHLFLSQPQKSPDISLLQGFLRHGEFR